MSSRAVFPMPNDAGEVDLESGGTRSGVPPAEPAPALRRLSCRVSIATNSSNNGWTPWFVPLMLVANAVMFIVTMYVNNCPARQHPQGACVPTFFRRFSFQPYQENFLIGPSASTLLKVGALGWDKVVHQHQGWRLVTSLWLHAGLVHLVFNVICMGLIGAHLERNFGFVRIGVIYLISGFGGTALSSFFLDDGSISVGASGPLFGLLGAMLAEIIQNHFLYTDDKGLDLLIILFTAAINAAVGIVPHVNNFAHIGGFFTGFLLGFPLLIKPRTAIGWSQRHSLPTIDVRVNAKYSSLQIALSVISLIMLFCGFLYVLLMLFTGQNGNSFCSWCHYLNCVPTDFWSCSA